MGSESRKKTKLIQVRCTPSEKAQLKQRADAFAISVGALTRDTIFATKVSARTDQAAISELAATRADLGRLGGLLKGWLAGSFPHSPMPHPAEIRGLLKQIEIAQEKVVAVARALA